MNVLIVFDHPYGAAASTNVPHHRSLSAALLSATMSGLEAAGHNADLIDLSTDRFDPVLTEGGLRDWRLGTTSDPQVLDYQSRLAAADHLVFIHPTWWMAMPAATKGFLDKVLTPGFAYTEPRPGGPLRRQLTRLGGVTVLTPMTTPATLYGLWFAKPAQRILFRGTFALIGIKHLRWFSYGRSAQRSAASRSRMLARTARYFESLPY